MANIVTTLFAIALILGGALTPTRASLSSASKAAVSWGRMEERTEERSRTEFTLITTDIQGSGADIDISFRNAGQTPLADFSSWDVVIQYFETSSNQDPKVVWVPYTTAAQPASGQWTVTGIYIDASAPVAEVYEPNVFNPGEEMIVRLNITPATPANTDNLVTLGAPHGVTLAAPFSR